MSSGDSYNGVAVIAVCLEFKDKSKNRKNALNDNNFSKHIWQNVFGFYTIVCLSPTKKKFTEKLEEAIKKCEKYRNLTIVISSHGCERKQDDLWKHFIRFYDGLASTKEIIIDKLNIKELRNVNKMVILQACRRCVKSENYKEEVDGPIPDPEDKGVIMCCEDGDKEGAEKLQEVEDDSLYNDTDIDDESDTDTELSSDGEVIHRLESLSIPGGVIMFGSASGRFSYRGKSYSSWLIYCWKEEVDRRVKLLRESLKGGQTADKIVEVSFLDMAINVTREISRQESENKNKAVGCIIFQLTKEIRLRFTP